MPSQGTRLCIVHTQRKQVLSTSKYIEVGGMGFLYLSRFLQTIASHLKSEFLESGEQTCD